MRFLVLMLVSILLASNIEAAGVDGRTFKFGGWIAQSVGYNNLSVVTADTTANPALPVLGNGNDVRLGDSEFAVKLDWEHEAKPVGGFVQTNLFAKQGGRGGVGVDFQELYLFGGNPKKTWTLLMGKYVVPIGFESVNTPDQYTMTHSLVFTNLLPTALTGLKTKWEANEFVSVQGYVGGPWETTEFLVAEAINAGGRLGGTFGDVGDMGLSLLWGDRDTTPNQFLPRVAIDLDGGLYLLDGDLVIAFEANLNVLKKEDPREFFLLNPFGIMLFLDWAYQEWGHVGFRFDYVADDESKGQTALWAPIGGEAQSRSSYTTVAGFKVAEVFDLRTEVRVDHSNVQPFLVARKGEFKHNYVSLNLGVIYEF